MSDKLRFAEIERLIVDTIKDLPDGWDYIMHLSLLKAEHEVAEDLRDEIARLEDTVATLEYEIDGLYNTVFDLESEISDLENRIGE